MAALKLYNTLSREKELFEPIDPPHVGLYTCGPTVYDYAHIGNLRTYVFEDILRRVLEYNGFRTKHVMNITDVGHLTSDADTGEDRMELGARREGKSAWEVAEFYTQVFLKDLERLNILKPHLMPKATEHIKEQIELVRELEEKGFTYRISDGIYFDISKFPDYGKLIGQSPEEREAGARIQVNPEKSHPADFALWKFSLLEGAKRRQMEWDSPWGVGFPGWHIECSVMSTKYLGQPFDIHTGGVDHIPTHHPNEIAQCEAAKGVRMANFWLHGEFLKFGTERMGKSLGNFIIVEDLIEEGFDPLAFRYLCLTAHYRTALNFTREALEGAQRSLDRLREHVRNYSSSAEPSTNEVIDRHKARFLGVINDDLNMPQALAVAWDLARSNRPGSAKLATLLDFDKVLGLRLDQVSSIQVDIPEEVQKLLDEREALRAQRRWKEADRIREKLAEMGYEVEDTPIGPRVRKCIYSKVEQELEQPHL